MILGLDISTSITGITVLDDSGAVVLFDMIDMRSKKFTSFFMKADAVERRLGQLKSSYNIDKIFLDKDIIYKLFNNNVRIIINRNVSCLRS